MLNYIPLVTGSWLIFSAMFINASSNFASKMFFKVIPMFLGLACLFAGGKGLGWF